MILENKLSFSLKSLLELAAAVAVCVLYFLLLCFIGSLRALCIVLAPVRYTTQFHRNMDCSAFTLAVYFPTGNSSTNEYCARFAVRVADIISKCDCVYSSMPSAQPPQRSTVDRMPCVVREENETHDQFILATHGHCYTLAGADYARIGGLCWRR